MQHFDLYNRSSILITISYSLKFLFREPRFHPSSPSRTSLSRLSTAEAKISRRAEELVGERKN